MKVVPEGRSDAVNFFAGIIPTWLANADAIGSNPVEMAAFADQIDAVRTALNKQQMAQSAALAATAAYNAKVDQLRASASVIIRQIRAKAASEGNGIYSLARISALKKPAPIAAPGEPTDFAFTVDGDGSLKLTWKCKNPRNASGTTYKIQRKTGLTGDFVYIGQAGAKRYTDSTVPAGASALTYRITAMRSTALGPCANFNINFGGGIVTPRTQSIQLASPRRLRRAA